MYNDYDKESNNFINNDKFNWGDGEVKIADSFCEFCKYNNNEQLNICSKYPNGKLFGVNDDAANCPYFDRKNKINLEDYDK